MSGNRLAFISVRAALAISFVAGLTCLAYLFDPDIRAGFIDSFERQAHFIGFPLGFLIAQGVLIVLNLPIAFACWGVLWVLDAVAPALTAGARLLIVSITAVLTAILWWKTILRSSRVAITNTGAKTEL